jgi:hypothetical protein
VSATTRVRTSLLLLAAPALLVACTAGTASAAELGVVTEQAYSPSISVKSDGWVQYKSELAVSGVPTTTVRVAGTQDAEGGCSLSGAATAVAGDTQASYIEEVGYNPATCQFDLRTTTATPTQIASLGSPLETTSTVNSITSSAIAPVLITKTTTDMTTDSLVTAAAASIYNRYLKTRWIDPINITISSQTVALQWTGTAWRKWAYKRDSFKGCVAGACLDKTYIVSGSDSFTTLTNGWRKQANVHFRNTSFAKWVAAVLGLTGWAACGFPTSFTANFHHQDIVTGYKSGSSAWSWSDSKSGACTNLVHHGTSTGASYPL